MMPRTNVLLALAVIALITLMTALSDSAKDKLQGFDITEGATTIMQKITDSDTKSSKKMEPPTDKPKEETPALPPLDPCTVKHPLSGAFFDLSPLGSLGSEGVTQAWNAKGFDYGMNFTLGICSSPLKKAVLAQGVEQEIDFPDAQNVSRIGGYYTDASGVKYSIGEYSTTPHFRGRKLVMEYQDGSFCKSLPSGDKIRRATLLSFTCDREIMAKAQVSFVGVLHDCDYFFEVRTIHACATAAKKDDLAIIWIFMLIFLAALGVYCSGGLIYKRMVLNRRGWNQLPSYGFMYKVKSIFTEQDRRPMTYDRVRFSNNFDYLGSQDDLLDVLDMESDSSEHM